MRRLVLHSDSLVQTVFFAFLLSLIFLASWRFIPLWFFMDDSANLYGSTKPLLSLLFDQETYLLFNKMFYSPLLPASFKIDFHAFVSNPAGYRLTNLLIVTVTGIVVYRIIMLYYGKTEAMLGTLLAVISYPMITNIGWITRRHYLFGTLFVLLSFYYLKKYEDRKKTLHYLLSLLSYTCSIFFKEAFTPFPLIALLLVRGRITDRLKKAFPFFLAFFCYLYPRFRIIGGLGGYISTSPGMDMGEFIEGAANLFRLFGYANWHSNLLLPLVLSLLVLFILEWRKALFLAGLLVISNAPFFLMKIPFRTDEYFLLYFPSKLCLTSVIAAIILVSILHHFRSHGTRLLIMVSLLVIVFIQFIHSSDAYSFLKKSTTHYRRFTERAFSENMRGRDLILIGSDAIFYNYYYETFRPEDKRRRFGRVITLSGKEIHSLLQEELPAGYDTILLDDNNSTKTEMFPETQPQPLIETVRKGRIISVKITDSREGRYVGILKTSFSKSNTAYQAQVLERGAEFRIGLVSSESLIFFYCRERICSPPVRIE